MRRGNGRKEEEEEEEEEKEEEEEGKRRWNRFSTPLWRFGGETTS